MKSAAAPLPESSADNHYAHSGSAAVVSAPATMASFASSASTTAKFANAVVRERPRDIAVSKKSTEQWLQRIGALQLKNITPEMREQVAARAVKKQKIIKQQRKCRSMMSASRKTKRSWAIAMDSMRSAPKQSRSFSNQAAAEMRSVREDLALSIAKVDAVDNLSAAPSAAVEVTFEAMAAEDENEAREEAEDVDENEMDKLLRNLRNEPCDDEECRAKFELYEAYHETVELARSETFKFWEDSKPEFAFSAAQVIENHLRSLDSVQNLAINAGFGREWFVYHMCRKVQQNSRVIEGILREIRTKLDLMARGGECPMCLEEFGSEHVPRMLSCCHKVCDECWAHWKTVQPQGRAFCPLCREVDFVAALSSQCTPRGVQLA